MSVSWKSKWQKCYAFKPIPHPKKLSNIKLATFKVFEKYNMTFNKTVSL